MKRLTFILGVVLCICVVVTNELAVKVKRQTETDSSSDTTVGDSSSSSSSSSNTVTGSDDSGTSNGDSGNNNGNSGNSASPANDNGNTATPVGAPVIAPALAPPLISPQVGNPFISPAIAVPVIMPPEFGEVCASDVVFALDQSTSMKLKDFRTMTRFASDLVTDLKDVGTETGTRVGLIKFSTFSKVEFDLYAHTTAIGVADDIIDTVPEGGYTNTSLALKDMKILFDSGRQNVPKIGILITDGNAQFPDKAFAAALELHNMGVHLAVIAIGTGLNLDQLRQLASSPTLFKPVANSDQLTSLKGQIDAIICQRVQLTI